MFPMEHKIPKIKDVIPLANGIFGHMDYTFRAEITKEQLDYLFMASFAKRNPAPVIDLLLEDEEERIEIRQLTDIELTKLAAMLLAMYKPRWDKLGDIYDVEYDPIHNYLDEWEDSTDEDTTGSKIIDRDESETLGTTVTKRNTRTDALNELTTKNLSDGNTRTNNLTEHNTGTVADQGANSSTDGIWGFNSNAAVNSDTTSGTNSNTRTDNLTKANTGTVTDVGTETGTVTVANTGTVTDNGSDATTGTNTRAIDETDTSAGTLDRAREGRHFGNIGNLTSQKMLNEEIELWKWNYVQSILEDARDFLTLHVYLCQSTNKKFKQEKEKMNYGNDTDLRYRK